MTSSLSIWLQYWCFQVKLGGLLLIFVLKLFGVTFSFVLLDQWFMQLPQHFLSVCQPCYFAFFNSKSFFNIFPQMLCRSLNVLLKSFGFFILSVLYSLDFSDCFHFSTPVNKLYQIKYNLYKVLQFLQNDISLFLRFFCCLIAAISLSKSIF